MVKKCLAWFGHQSYSMVDGRCNILIQFGPFRNSQIRHGNYIPLSEQQLLNAPNCAPCNCTHSQDLIDQFTVKNRNQNQFAIVTA